MAAGAAAVAAWLGYVVANISSRCLPIVAGAVVGGALWAGLAWWSGGVLASLASHILWTGLMLALPPGAGRPRFRFRSDAQTERGARVSFLSTAVQQVLDEGPFCAVATSTPRGPHCTPLVFAYSGGRIWLTTSRGSVKTRAWKVDPSVSGLVRSGELSVTFTGTCTTYDALDRSTWGAAVAGATSIARATAVSARRTLEFFAGLRLRCPSGAVGVDAAGTGVRGHRSRTDRAARRGRCPGGSRTLGRRGRVAPDVPLAQAGPGSARRVCPPTSRPRSGAAGRASLTVAGARGPVSLPARWLAEPSALYAALPAETLALAGAGPDAAMALTIDQVSEWRARDMVGAMVQGDGSIYVLDALGSGAKTAKALAAGLASGLGRAGAHRALAPGLVEGLVERERAGRMTTVEFSVEVEAPPEQVWTVASDPRNLPHWDRTSCPWPCPRAA